MFCRERCRMLLTCVVLLVIPYMVDATCLQATIDMSGVKGTITFEQPSTSSDTVIKANLTADAYNKLEWKIHELPVSYRGNAKRTCHPMYIGSVYDPTYKLSETNYKIDCTSHTPNNCAIGDLTSKHGYIDTGANTFKDSLLPLSGPHSIFTRSIVFYNGSSTPVFCALIDSCDDVITAVATFRGDVTGTITLRQVRGSPNMDTALDINLFYSREITSNYDMYKMSLSHNTLPMMNGIPSYNSTECPTELEKQPSPFIVQVPKAVDGPSTHRKVLNLINFPLSGKNSIVGGTLVAHSLLKPEIKIICASVCERLPLEAQAMFDIDGVSGYLNFKQQSEFSATKVEVNIKGLQKKANTYHVHVFQVEKTAVDTKKNMKGSCANVFVAGHWNPYGTKSLAPGIGTVDQYEIGDLSGKYGFIGSVNELKLNYNDYNLPLFGANSIIYRSMVIHYNNGSRWVCANIYPKNPSLKLKVKAVFDGPDIQGFITVEQASFLKDSNCSCSSSHITTMFTHFEYKDKSHQITKDHNWHIHDYPVSSKEEGLCLSTAGHYNPYAVSLKPKMAYYNECGSGNILRCELGDLSGKLGRIDIDGSKKRFSESENYFASIYSILGRSIVLHSENSGASRIACSSLVIDSYKMVEKTITFKKTTKTNLDDFQSTLADVMNVCKWQITMTKRDTHLTCETFTFTLVDDSTSDLADVFDKLNENWPDKLGSYKPVSKTEENCKSKAAMFQHSTVMITVITYILTLFNWDTVF